MILLSGFSDEISSEVIKQFEVLNKLGISYFEPRGINGKNISVIDDDEVALLKDNMKKYNIKASSIGSPIGKIKVSEDFETFKRVIPAGMRDGEIEFILKSLSEKGYSGFVSLEPHLGSFEGLADLELDDAMLDLPKSGEGTFTIAYNALADILKKL